LLTIFNKSKAFHPKRCPVPREKAYIFILLKIMRLFAAGTTGNREPSKSPAGGPAKIERNLPLILHPGWNRH
jgi:hypothetical protein